MTTANDWVREAGKFRSAQWGYAGMRVTLRWTGRHYVLRSARGPVAFGTKAGLIRWARERWYDVVMASA